MDALSDAVALGRALLSLERVAATGVVAIGSPRGRGRIRICEGALDAVSTAFDADVLLGDLLLQSRELDRRAYEAALAIGMPTQPVGRWLVETGAASVESVRGALQRQARSRVVAMLGWPSVEYEFLPSHVDSDMRSLGRRLAVAPLVVEALRQRMAEQPRAWLERQLDDGPYELLPWARDTWEMLFSGDEASTVAFNVSPGSRALRRAVGGSEVGIVATQVALKWLGGLRPTGMAACSLMLRKREQLRRAARPDELLDLQPGASTEQARRALRRLARDLHPDRLGPHAPASLRAASTQILSALNRAEHVVRGGPSA